MPIDVAAATHPGQVRRINEDAFLVGGLEGEEPRINRLLPDPTPGPMGLLAAVADGLGGAVGGDVASLEGLAAFSVCLFGHWGRFPAAEATEEGLLRALRTAALEASAAVLRFSDSDRTVRGMTSTLTAAVVWRNRAYLCHVGDTRAYLYRGAELVRLTHDHALGQSQVGAGPLSRSQGGARPHQGLITQALGSPRPIVPDIAVVPLCRGDLLLLCSDGLHQELGEAELEALLAPRDSARRTADRLLAAAMEKGARDNVTALVLSLDDPGLPPARPGGKVALTPVAAGEGSHLHRLSGLFRDHGHGR